MGLIDDFVRECAEDCVNGGGSMSKHTPGPWSANGKANEADYVVRDQNGHALASVFLPTNVLEAEANARLIAAAPDLLEALQGIVAADFESVPRTAVYRAVKLLQDEARAAIAKAEGGE